MAGARRPLSSADFDHLEVDGAGELHWRGRRVRVGGWSTSERLALGSAIISGLLLIAIVLANFETIKATVIGGGKASAAPSASAPGEHEGGRSTAGWPTP